MFTEWMGRSPTLVEDQVTYPIVSKLIGAPHVTDVRGFSMFGMSFVYVVFEEGTDIYWARSRVLEYMSGAARRAARGRDADARARRHRHRLGLPVRADRQDAASTASTSCAPSRTSRCATRSAACPGVAEVASVGGYQKQYQVTVDPNRLRAYGVTLSRRDRRHPPVEQRRRRAHPRVVGARVLRPRARLHHRTSATIEKIARPRPRPERHAGCSSRTSATVRFGPDIRRGLLEWNGEGEAVGGIVVMRYGENALDVIERVKKKFAELAAELSRRASR